MRDHVRMSEQDWKWRSPPGWPEPPSGWAPPPGWQASPEWPAPPADWARTGQGPAALGLGMPGLRSDLGPAAGLAVGGYGLTLLIALPFSALIAHHGGLFSQIHTGHVPKYYILYGLAISAVTAITEETPVSGYLLTAPSRSTTA
jgi:hypothetical protein